MQGLTIHEAARTTGWSPRMLRYLDRVGLVQPSRSESGYRLFGAAELRRLRSLRELVDSFGCALSDVAFAERMRGDDRLRQALDQWFDEQSAKSRHAGEWLRLEKPPSDERVLTPTQAA